MSLDPHCVQQLATQKLQPDDALIGVVRQIFLQQKQIIWQPDGWIRVEDCLQLRQRFDDMNPRAAAALVRLQQRRPAKVVRVRAQSADIVERDRAGTIDPECAQQCGLDALAQLEGEHVSTVQNPYAQKLEGSHVGERQRNRPRVTPEIRAWAGLIEVERPSRCVDVAECLSSDVEWSKRDASSLERRKQRLLPFGMLVKDDQIRC